MAIALPPPIEPQQATVAQLQSQALAQTPVVIDYQGFKLHVTGDLSLDAGALHAAVATARNMSDAVRTVADFLYLSGYPAVLTYYAWAGGTSKDVYIHAVPGRVTSVIAPAQLQPYFDDLPQKAPLTAANLETDRVLADLYSERGAQQYRPLFKPTEGDAVTLDLGEPTVAGQQSHVVGLFNNYGNRFAGPYFTALAAQQRFSTGDELQLSAAVKSGPEFYDYGKTDGSSYLDLTAGWTRVTSFGVFGIDGRRSRYDQLIEDFPLDGRVNNFSANWLYPLYSDYDQRLLLSAKIDHTDQNIKVNAAAAPALTDLVLDILGALGLPLAPNAGTQELLDEDYESTEVSLSYLARTQFLQRALRVEGGLLARKGLGPENSARTTANQDYFLWRPTLNLRYTLTDGWALLGDAYAQFSNNPLPQQEQYVIGGPSSVRAFRPGAGVGDEGQNFRLAVEWQGPADSWLRRQGLAATVFAEQASTRGQRRSSLDEAQKVSVADVGVSLDLRLVSWLSGSLSVSDAIRTRGENNSPDQLDEKNVYFQITARY